jgi:hypothetical protein
MRKFHGMSAQIHVDELVDVIKQLYHFYAAAAAPTSSRPKGGAMEIDTADLLVDNADDELENFLYESSGRDATNLNELEKYMADPPLRLSGQLISWHGGRTRLMSILFFQR